MSLPSPMMREQKSAGCGLEHQYIPSKGLVGLDKHKYRSNETSLLYNHVLSPLAAYLVEFLPTNLAPNLITVIGFSAVLVNYYVLGSYTPNLTEEAPRWAYFLCGIGMLFYQTMDNMDGKQARRTGNSSPLGQLFDHGCDALNIFVTTISACATLRIGGGMGFTMLIGAVSAFYMATWEEYNTGCLFLGIVNGASEGTLATATLHLAAAAFGPDFWINPWCEGGIPRNIIIFRFMVCFAVVTIAMNIHAVWKHYYVDRDIMGGVGHEEAPHAMEEKAPKTPSARFSLALTYAIPCAVLALSMSFWVALSPTNILRTNPRTVLSVAGVSNGLLVGHLILTHVCQLPYFKFHLVSIAPVLVGISNVMLATSPVDSTTSMTPVPPVSEPVVAFFGLCFLVIAYGHFAVNVGNQITDHLGIFWFKCGKARASIPSSDPTHMIPVPPMTSNGDMEEGIEIEMNTIQGDAPVNQRF